MIDHGGGKSVHLRVLLVLLICTAAMMALVSLSLDQPAWEIAWIHNGGISRAVLQALDTLRYELSILAVIGLNTGLYLCRAGADNALSTSHQRARASTERSWQEDADSGLPDAQQRTDADSAAGWLNEDGGQPAEPDTLNDPPVATATSLANAAAQLQIATAEITRLRAELLASRQALELATQGQPGSLVDSRPGADRQPSERGIRQLDKHRFSLRDDIDDLLVSLNSLASAKNVVLSCQVDSDVPAQMFGDGVRIRQIMHTLIGNAIDATDEGEVRVRVLRKQTGSGTSTYQCEVEDSGKGIGPELQIELYRVFAQETSAAAEEQDGIGVGLLMVKRLVSLMHGDVSFRSRLGEGSCFSFSMTLEDVAERSADTSRRRSVQGARVLVVDDNETNRTILYHQLSNWGVLVETVNNGKVALQTLRAAQERDRGFEVLIMDLNMPEMDGIQLARAVQAEPELRHIKSIMLTSSKLQLDSMELRMLGIGEYVSKPARQSELHDSLAALLFDDVIAEGHGTRQMPLNSVPLAAANARITEADLSAMFDDTSEHPATAMLPGGARKDDLSDEHMERTVRTLQEIPGTAFDEQRQTSALNDADSSDSLIDLQAIERIRRLQTPGKSDLLGEVVTVYLNEAPQLIDTMQQAMQKNDLDGVAQCAHSLESSSAYLGAQTLRQRCHQIKQAIDEGTHKKLQALVAGSSTDYAQVSEALGGLLKAA